MRKKRLPTIILTFISVISIMSFMGCNSGKDPYITKDQAKKVLDNKGYTIEEKDSFELLDGTEAEGNYLIATKGKNFVLIFTLVDMNQSEDVKEAIKSEYSYNHYVVHNDVTYVMTKQSAKDLGISRYINLIK